jgi:hypothetical protein
MPANSAATASTEKAKVFVNSKYLLEFIHDVKDEQHVFIPSSNIEGM